MFKLTFSKYSHLPPTRRSSGHKLKLTNKDMMYIHSTVYWHGFENRPWYMVCHFTYCHDFIDVIYNLRSQTEVMTPILTVVSETLL